MWSFSPLSGEGAAIHGGRFNPRGVPALYLSLTIDGAVAEAAQAFAAKLEPLVICLYEVDCEDVLDLSTEDGRAGADVSLVNMASPWAFDLSNGLIPASWVPVRQLIKQGCAGIVVPSLARHAREGTNNLVLWKWGAKLPHRGGVHDPSGRLPKNQLSWDTQ